MFLRCSPFRARRRMAGQVCVLAYCVAMLQGCYVYTAPPAAPAAGTALLVEVNDVGRVGLGNSLGPSVKTVEGTTISNTDSAFLLRILKVGYLNGQSTDWTGESLAIPRSFASDVRQKQFSSSRSWGAAAVAGALVIAFALTRGLIGSGSGGKDPGPPVPAPQ